MFAPLDRDDRPPRPGPNVEIKRLKANHQIHVLVLGMIQGYWVHWNGLRSEPCFQDHQTCPGHLRQLPRRWKGYLHCFDLVERVELFLELTPLAVKQVKAVCGQESGWRGVRMSVKRHNGDRTRLTVEVSKLSDNVDRLPAAKDVWPVLAQLWGMVDDVPSPCSTELPSADDFE